MITVLVDRPLDSRGGRWSLTTEERHHLRVRRAGEGEPVRVLDGAGRVGEGRLIPGDQGLAVEVACFALHLPLGTHLLIAVVAHAAARAWP